MVLPMVQWNKTAKFKKLQDKWYKKLEKSGFLDAEQDEVHLKHHSGKTRIAGDEEGLRLGGLTLDHPALISIGATNKYNYYLRCREFLGEFKFKNKMERQVFEMHSEGLGERVIAKNLKTYRTKITTILKRLIREMNEWKKEI